MGKTCSEYSSFVRPIWKIAAGFWGVSCFPPCCFAMKSLSDEAFEWVVLSFLLWKEELAE